MDKDFLNYLAEQKHRLYMYLYRENHQASTSVECYDRIKKNIKYETILESIAFLSLESQLALTEIEYDRYPDAPYLTKRRAPDANKPK